MKILIFTEGTILMHSSGFDVSREERVLQVKNFFARAPRDFKSYIPVENSVETVKSWVSKGFEIYYLTSRRTLDEIADIQNVLIKNGFPSGQLLFRNKGEKYKDVAEKLLPDILIEDDCESIGGEPEMTYTNVDPKIKSKIKHIAVKEFGGIDKLADVISYSQ